MWEQTLKLEINCIQNSQDDAEWTATSLISRGRLEMAMTIVTDIEMTVRADCAILPPPSIHTALKLPFKTFCLLSSNRELVLGHKSMFSPGCWHTK